ncbi:MAG: hypothetical protein RL757_2551 [Bacteroidota bacterium]|jgi:hypothetical protein
MKKDLLDLRVEDVIVALVPEYDDDIDGEYWDAYILNLKEEPLKMVMITSRGYGENEKGEKIETTKLRYFFDFVMPNEVYLIEPVEKTVLTMANEYWISFMYDGHMYDKKYIFVPGSVSPEHFTNVPVVNRKGVMIR